MYRAASGSRVIREAELVAQATELRYEVWRRHDLCIHDRKTFFKRLVQGKDMRQTVNDNE